jgi:hypothetical protein
MGPDGSRPDHHQTRPSLAPCSKVYENPTLILTPFSLRHLRLPPSSSATRWKALLSTGRAGLSGIRADRDPDRELCNLPNATSGYLGRTTDQLCDAFFLTSANRCGSVAAW